MPSLNKVNEVSSIQIIDMRAKLAIAIQAAERAGRIIYGHWGELGAGQVFEKSSWRDLVTVADREAECAILQVIQEAYPGHGIISEEGGGITTDSEFQWVIDPLDGTTNFRHSYPFFAVSIGLLHRGRSVLGVIYDPVKDELFTATEGGGAYLNGRPLKVSRTAVLKDSLLVTGFAYQDDLLQSRSLQAFQKLNFATHGIRRDGSAALDLAYVAAGRLDGFWEYGLKIWDIAAGVIIVEEAGGVIIRPDGQPLDFQDPQILATTPCLVDSLRAAFY